MTAICVIFSCILVLFVNLEQGTAQISEQCLFPPIRGNCHQKFFYNPDHQICEAFVGNCGPSMQPANEFDTFEECKKVCMTQMDNAAEMSTYPKCNEKEGKILLCTKPSYCDATCQNPYPYCAEYKPCYTRCVCKQGLVLDKKSGRCIKYKYCPKKIAEVTDISCPIQGQEFNDCASACDATCKDPYPFCTKQCVARCECPHDMVLDEYGAKCIEYNECPHKGNVVEAMAERPPKCELPRHAGEFCVDKGLVTRFYYDLVMGSCMSFTYAGCGGNENNFESMEECLETCDGGGKPLEMQQYEEEEE